MAFYFWRKVFEKRMNSGAPDRNRTHNLQIRSLALYPVELRARKKQRSPFLRPKPEKKQGDCASFRGKAHEKSLIRPPYLIRWGIAQDFSHKRNGNLFLIGQRGLIQLIYHIANGLKTAVHAGV